MENTSQIYNSFANFIKHITIYLCTDINFYSSIRLGMYFLLHYTCLSLHKTVLKETWKVNCKGTFKDNLRQKWRTSSSQPAARAAHSLCRFPHQAGEVTHKGVLMHGEKEI